MASRSREFSPAMVASLALHLGVFGLAFVSWPWTRELSVGASVPINIVSNAPDTNLRQAVQAPEEQTAQTDQPVPDAPAEAAAPDPAPDILERIPVEHLEIGRHPGRQNPQGIRHA